MNRFYAFLFICFYSFTCRAQELAIATPSANENAFYYVSAGTPGKTHSQSVVTSIGTWSMLGGAVIFIGGYIEYKSATKTDGPFTFVDESKQHLGTSLEIAGGVCFVTGLTMVIVDAINRHTHHAKKVSIIALKGNEIGLAYKF